MCLGIRRLSLLLLPPPLKFLSFPSAVSPLAIHLIISKDLQKGMAQWSSVWVDQLVSLLGLGKISFEGLCPHLSLTDMASLDSRPRDRAHANRSLPGLL